MGSIHLITGGVKSGKSSFALRQASEVAGEKPVRFIATARRGIGDESLDDRISRHVAERPSHWTLFEPPASIIESLTASGDEVLTIVDCVTLLIGDLVSAPDYDHAVGIAEHVAGFVELLRSSERPTLVITNEVGLGVSPPTTVGNDFADELGTANRVIADAADKVTLLIAGQPLQIK